MESQGKPGMSQKAREKPGPEEGHGYRDGDQWMRKRLKVDQEALRMGCWAGC